MSVGSPCRRAEGQKQTAVDAPVCSSFTLLCSALQESASLSLSRSGEPRKLPALLFSCQVGVGRTNLAMILGTLVMNRLSGDAQPQPRWDWSTCVSCVFVASLPTVVSCLVLQCCAGHCGTQTRVSAHPDSDQQAAEWTAAHGGGKSQRKTLSLMLSSF